ncbi:MAG: tetratricopeptide repeat protein, partial [Candidatus Odinarchaeota archaeon]
MKDILSDAKKAFNSGKLKKARLILETLLATSDAEIGNKEIRIRASLLLTDIDMAEGSYSKSLESCWNLLTQKPPDIFLSEIYRKIGTIFRRKGETRQAEEYFLKSRDVSLTDEQRIRSFISLSGLYRIQSRFNKAISHGKEAFDLALAVQGQDNKYEELIAESLINLGLVKYNQGEFEAALPFFYQARDIYEQQEDCEAISRIKIMVANVLSRQGKYNEALDLYK